MSDLSSKLEPFLLLARSTKGAAAAKIIMDATAAPGVYTFSELLEFPNIQELSIDPTYQNHHRLLQLFAYGTLADYETATSSYPQLTPSHILKLKHLTLVSLALTHRSLPYDQLLSSLRLDTIRQLEDLIIDVIYAGLLGGKMHHHEKVLHVDWVSGRDLQEKDLLTVQEGLVNWCKTADTLLSALDTRILELKQSSAQESARSNEYKIYRDREYQIISTELKNTKSKSNPFGERDRAFRPAPPPGVGGFKDFGVGGEINQDALLAGLMGGAGGSGRLLTRNVPSPDELDGVRSFKRSRD
ncbi:hypothetical protein I302_108089 [Kwoniella bestiolae CBS 10118]|uniref:PCI domain-containing protein n=1 Tax=Kwoniella bestiolae CBS 10118 TaxID=1296100 RepID=A0A1B9FWQ6_9TREE|nr:hypothetical protein I302_07545 [Kwoniella bestiolae CBS 10118]OCF23191.1 hypothetical protein I302_07545 [Kwoniella bestiolae CBS 10118]